LAEVINEVIQVKVKTVFLLHIRTVMQT